MSKFMDLLIKFFTPPQNIPVNEVYKAQMLYFIITAYIAILFVGIVYAILSPPWRGLEFRIIVISLAFMKTPTIILLKKEQWNLTTLLLIIPLWIVISYGSFISGGLYASATLLYAIPIILAVTLLSNRFAIGLTAITIIYVFILMLLEHFSIVDFPLQKTLLYRFYISIVASISILASLIYHKEKLKTSEALNHKLALDRKVSEIQNYYSTSISHDLRTPLSVIQSQTYIINKRNEKGMPIAENIKKIDNHIQKLSRTIDDFIEFSRLTNEITQVVALESVELSNIIIQTIDSSRFYFPEKNIKIEFEHSTTKLANSNIQGQPEYLCKMLQNIVYNSIEYGKQDGQTCIELSYYPNYVEIKIIDDGIGMTPQQQEQIFEPFYRADEARTSNPRTGSGIGLPVSQLIAKLHHGYISVHSELGIGSTFTITLPLYNSF